MASDQHVNLLFESKAIASDTFKVVRFEGEEAISQPFRFEIVLVSEEPDIDAGKVLGQPATLSMQRGDDGPTRRINGILSEFTQDREGQYGHYLYRAVLVPRLWLLSLSQQNQIYQNMAAHKIVEEELIGAQDKGPAELAAIGLTSEDFEFRLSGDHPKREYTVQYQETDFAFVSRLLEHQGIFYFFEHDDQREKVVFCDDNVHVPPLNGDSEIVYRLPSGTSSTMEDSVQAFRRRQRQITAKMILKDYNYRTPTTPLQGEADIDDAGHGLIAEYGNHFKTPEEGQSLAKSRAQEVLSRKIEFTGESDRLSFAAGHPFTLKEHYNGAFDQDYLLVQVRHSGSQAFSEATGFAEFDGQASSYRNDFTVIPLSVAFRPARTTPKPKLHGVMNGHVDASGPGTRAEIDSEGRYKLVMPFDLSGQAEAKATRWVRMAQPYGGGQQGMHFPLHKGTEVIWTCLDGDPDRPIITGVVPNPLNKSVIDAESHTKNRIKTASGILIEMNDGAGPPPDDEGQGQGGAMAGQQQMQRLSGPSPADIVPVPAQSLLTQQQLQPDTVTESDAAGPNDIWLKLGVPSYHGNNSSYVRYGKHDPNNEAEDGCSLTKDPATNAALPAPVPLELNNAAAKPADVAHQLDGVLDYTSGNRTEITLHNREVKVIGKNRIDIGDEPGKPAWTDYKRKVGSSVTGADIWRQTTLSYGSKDSWHFGDKEIGTVGLGFSGFAGLATGVKLGGSLSLTGTADVDYGYAFSVSAKKGANVDLCAESQNTSDAEDHDMIGGKTISIRIKGPIEKAADKTHSMTWKSFGAGVAAVTAGALTAGVANSSVPFGNQSEDKASTWAARIGFPLSTLAWAGAVAHGYYKNKAVDANQALSPSQINLDKDKVELMVGPAGTGSSLVMDQNSITFKIGANKIRMTRLGVHIIGDRVVEITGGNIVNATAKNGLVTLKGSTGKQVIP